MNKNYSQSQYQDDGSMVSGTITVSGNIWNYNGTMVLGGKQYMIKNTATFAADLMSITIKAEISADGKSWTPFGDFKYTKAKAAPIE